MILDFRFWILDFGFTNSGDLESLIQNLKSSSQKRRSALLSRAEYTNLLQATFFRNMKTMEVHFSPDLQAKIDQLVIETGRAPDKLLEDAMAGYLAELVQTREMLDSRYDDLKSGRVKPIPGDEVIARLREKSAARRVPPRS